MSFVERHNVTSLGQQLQGYMGQAAKAKASVGEGCVTRAGPTPKHASPPSSFYIRAFAGMPANQTASIKTPGVSRVCSAKAPPDTATRRGSEARRLCTDDC